MGTRNSADAAASPAACTLTPDDGATRMGRWRALAAAAHPTASRIGRTLEVHFEQGPGVNAELATLARAEQECCSFVTWTVIEGRGCTVLRVVAKPDSPDDVASIAALFGVT